MKSRFSMVVGAAALLAGCVAGNPGNGSGGPRPDAGPDEVEFNGGSLQLEQCGYPVVTRSGASKPVLGSAKLGANPDPYQIRLGIAGPPPTSMVVQWETRDQSTLATTVQYGKAAVSEHTQEGVTFLFGTGFSGTGDPVRVHETHLCGLEADTQYVYRVGGVGADGAEKWSKEFHFRTAPDAHADPSAQVTVLVLGDTRDGYDTWGKLLKAGQTMASPDLILFTGDAVTFGQLQEQWDAFLDASGEILAGVPMVAAHGNHETNSINFFSLMAMPGNEQNFSFDYGPFHLTVLNDTPEDPSEIAGKQRDFLAADLIAHDSAPWKFVLHHKPLWSAASHGNDVELLTNWGPLYDAHHVDLVINGHDHNYERSFPMFGSQVKASPAEGTVFLVAGSAGVELYDNGHGFWTAYSEKAQNMVVLKVRAGQLQLDAFRADGTAMDSLQINK